MERIPDEAIRKAFIAANSVSLSVRGLRNVQSLLITFGDLGIFIPLIKVAEIVGITPQNLRPVFNRTEKKVARRPFPFNWSWLGLNKNLYQVTEVKLPRFIRTYQQLGNLPSGNGSFQKLACLLGKSVEVLQFKRESGYQQLFIAHPSGKLIHE